MAWLIEEWVDSNQSLTMASIILAASLEWNPGMSIASQQNAINFTL